MLGVFRIDLKKFIETALKFTSLPLLHRPALKDDNLEASFISRHNHAVSVNLGIYGFLAYKEEPLPRVLYSAKDGIYCISESRIERKGDKMAESGGHLIDDFTADYKHVQEKVKNAPFIEVQIAKRRNYNCILFDNSVQGNSRTALVVNCLEDKPLYLGLDSEGSCIITDDKNIIHCYCGNCFKSIRKGHGLLIPVSVAPQVDSSGEISSYEASASSSGVRSDGRNS